MNLKAIALAFSVISGMLSLPNDAEAKCRRCGRDQCNTCYEQVQECCAPAATCCMPMAACVAAASSGMNMQQMEDELLRLKADHSKLRDEVELLKQQQKK